MKVVLLSANPERATDIFKDDILLTQSHNGPIPDCDWIISYGHRHILKGDVLTRYKERVINAHISLLPWNRGASPNFWSWYDNTPKGVTIHYIDEGVDTGDIIIQNPVRFLHPERETLASSYFHLQRHAVMTLATVWNLIKSGKTLPRIKQPPGGTLHKKKDLEGIRLPAGWATPVEYIEDMGRRAREEAERDYSRG